MTSRYRNALPQMTGQLVLTDGGMETTLIFHEGLDLPDFAAFTLLQGADGRVALRRYYDAYCAASRRAGVGCLLEGVMHLA